MILCLYKVKRYRLSYVLNFKKSNFVSFFGAKNFLEQKTFVTISCSFFKSHSITTKKTRFISKGHSHLKKLFEVYKMEDEPISKQTEKKIYKYLKENIRKYDLVIVNDYY